MRLVCIHADTVDALQRLNIQVDDLTPQGLWSTPYHLVGLTADQSDALEQFQVEMEDLTPAPLLQAVDQDARGGVRGVPSAQTAPGGSATPVVTATGYQRIPAEAVSASSDQTGRDIARAAAGGAEAEVPLAQGRDGGTRAGGETKPAAPGPSQAAAAGRPQPAAAPAGGGKP